MKTVTSNEIKVELKAIKFHEDMSEETNCFSANIYLNGKKVGSVKNQGHGGCNFYDFAFKNKNRENGLVIVSPRKSLTIGQIPRN